MEKEYRINKKDKEQLSLKGTDNKSYERRNLYVGRRKHNGNN